LNRLTENNKNNIERIFTFHTNKFTSALDKLILLNPLATMSRGFSLAYRTTDDTVIKSVKDVKIEDEIEVQVNDGRLSCEVIDKKLEEPDVPIEKAIKYYEKGMELSKICDKVLSNAEKKMTKILDENDQPTLFDLQEE